MVAGLGFPEEPEPVGGHVDDRGIRVCGPGFAPASAFRRLPTPDSVVARSADSRAAASVAWRAASSSGVSANALYPQKVAARPPRPLPGCHRSADPPCRSHHRMRSPAGDRVSCPELRGPTASVPPPSRRRVPCREPAGGSGDSFPTCIDTSAVWTEAPAVFGAFPAVFAV